jgi:hypothetical protein
MSASSAWAPRTAGAARTGATRSRTPRGSVGVAAGGEVAELRAALAAAEATLRAERARAAARDLEWLAAYRAVTDNARELAALARAAGAAGDVVDDWLPAAPPAPAEPEREPEPEVE